MPWNYRVIKTSEQFSVHEVYYKDDEMSEVEGYSAQPAHPRGDSFEELLEDIQRYVEATQAPILFEDFDGAIRPIEDRQGDGGN